MNKRLILVAVIGYIIGILVGLYFKISIVPLYCLIAVIYLIKQKIYIKQKKKFNFISIYRYFRYIKLIFNQKVILIIVIRSIISNSIFLIQNQKYETLYNNLQEVDVVGYIISNKKESKYRNIYYIKVESLNNSKKYKDTRLILRVKKTDKETFSYGDKVVIKGEFIKPEEQRNYGGFSYKEYLKTKSIYGSVNSEKIIKITKVNNLFVWANNIFLKLTNTIDRILEKEEASLLKGILLGDISNIEEEVYEKFQTSNMAHILAVSGMHISYIIIGTNLIFKKLIGKRKAKYVIILILIIYAFVSGFSTSIIRASIMGILITLSGIVHRKNDIWTSMSISLLIILIYNPFLITNIGLQLSYFGVIGIILLNKNILGILNKIKSKRIKKVYLYYKGSEELINKIKEIISVTLSVQIMIFPIVLYHFNFVGIYFIITSLITSIIVGPIIFLGIISIILFTIFEPISKGIVFLLRIALNILIKISNLSNLVFAKIYLPTPKIWMIVSYYLIIFVVRFIYSIYNKRNANATERRFRNVVELLKFKKRNSKINYKTIIYIFIIFILLNNFIPKNLKIYFVDVGQGDCTFIVTPYNKTILIDGGGEKTDGFNVGKKTLLPYILDRRYTKIDYVIISHFDQDHVRFDFIFIRRNKN